MSTFFAVVLFALGRALFAGYGGPWFAPVIATEALDASWPFLVVGAVAAVLRRVPRERTRTTGVTAPVAVDPSAVVALEAGVACALLVARFGNGWIDPHTSVAELVAPHSGTSWPLLLAGCVIGLAAAAVARRRDRLVQCLLVGAAGWLILGPEVYARFDDVRSAPRVAAASAIAAVFVAFALLCRIVFARSRRPAQALEAVLAVAAALALLGTIAAPGARPAQGGASVVLVAVDTLRADALDRTRPDGSPLMPRLAALAGSGVRFTQAIAPAPWTLPSMVSLLSGMNPHRHRTGRVSGIVALPGDPSASWSGPALRAEGYQVAAFVNNPWLRPYYGVGLGYLALRRYHGNASDGVTVMLDWLAHHALRPSFVFLHFMDPHWPYDAPAGYGEPRRTCAVCDDLRVMQYRGTDVEVHNEVRRRYDAEVAYTDAQIGRLWDELRARGVLDHTWFIVTSDHGEEFWEHQSFLHGHSLYDELLRVPLVVVPPLGDGLAPRGVHAREQVRLEDVAATVFDVAGVRPPFPLDGASLRAEYFVRDPAAPIVTSRTARPEVAGYVQLEGNRAWAVRASGAKLISGMTPLPLLFDLQADPGETLPITFEKPQITIALQSLPATLGLDVAGEAPVTGGPSPNRIDASLEHELRTLGYVK